MADFFGIAESTLNAWKLAHLDFSESLKKGKLCADANVSDRLYLRAMGYSHEEVHVSNYQGDITLTPLTKHYPPDTTAAIFWLKNRRPEQWREKSQHELSGPGGSPLVPVVNVSLSEPRPRSASETGPRASDRSE